MAGGGFGQSPPLLGPGPMQERSSPHIGVDYVSDKDATAAFQSMSKRAISVCYAGDARMKATDQIGALAVYVKGLALLDATIAAVRSYQQTRHRNEGGGQLEQEEPLSSFAIITEWLEDSYRLYVEHARSLAEALMDSTQHVSSCPCAEKIIFDFSLELSRDAAVDEMMCELQLAFKKYKHAYRLLEQLVADVEAGGSYAGSQQDGQTLHTCMAELFSRIECVQKKQLSGV